MQIHTSLMHDPGLIDAQLTMILEENILHDILTALNKATIYDLLSSLLASPALTSHLTVQRLKTDLPDILNMLGSHSTLSTPVTEACHNYMVQKYGNEALHLVSKKNGWHFSAWHTSAEQLEAFSLKDMVRELMAQVPLLWDLLGNLLNADPHRERRRTTVQTSPTGYQHCKQSDRPADVIPGNEPEWDDEDEYWAQIEDNIPLQTSPEANEIMDGTKRQRWAAQSRSSLIQIVSSLRLRMTND